MQGRALNAISTYGQERTPLWTVGLQSPTCLVEANWPQGETHSWFLNHRYECLNAAFMNKNTTKSMECIGALMPDCELTCNCKQLEEALM